jgi:UDPglucose 6-dehydrogenase
VVKAWVANSRHRRNWAVHTLRKEVLQRNPAAEVAVWGLAYKENTHSTKNSPSLATIAQLPEVVMRLHDPVVPPQAARHPRAVAAKSALDALRGADALMILTPWPEYREIAPAGIAEAMRGRVVLDPYAILDKAAARAAGLQIHTLGRSADA